MVPFERGIMRRRSVPRRPTRELLLDVRGKLEDRGGGFRAVVVFFIFSCSYENWNQIDVARERDDSAGVFAMRRVTFKDRGFERSRRVMGHCAVGIAGDQSIGLAQRREMLD